MRQPRLPAGLRLGPDGVCGHDTRSEIMNWPVDDGGSLPVELTALAVFDSRAEFH
jgi:hypothetical protein